MNTQEDGPLKAAELSGSGLRLRMWREEDAAEALRGLNDPQVQFGNAGLADVVDPAGVLTYIRSRAEGWEKGTQASYCVTDAESGTVLGHIGLHQIELRMRHAGIGYWLLPEARGRGIATRAVELCTRWGFEKLGLHRINLAHALSNDASCRVAERCGYLYEGVLRGYLPAKGGGYHDMHAHARLATDRAPRWSAGV
jgi:RimJ/RimL family protein N-acetyltransferase